MPIRKKIAIAVTCAAISLGITNTVSAAAKSGNTPFQATLSGEFVYKYLIGEIAGQRDQLDLSSALFLDLAKSSQDSRLAERAAKTAVMNNDGRTAIEAVNLWSQLDPASTEAHQALTQMLINIGKLNEAKPHLKHLLANEEGRASGFMFLNNLLARQQNKAEVLALIQELARDYPDLPESHFAVAHAAWGAGNIDLATSELSQADKLRPGWEMAALMQGQILLGQSPAQAESFYRDFLEQNDNANEVRLALARILAGEKKFDEAKNEFIKLIEASNGNPEILVVIGLLSLQANQLDEAETYFKDALNKEFKDKSQIYIYLGQIAEKKRNDDEALQWYNKVATDDIRYVDSQLGVANVITRREGIDAAIQSLENLPNLTETQRAAVIHAQANVLTQARRYQEAYDRLELAVSTLPNTPEIIYDFAMAAERIDNLNTMERELRKLIKIQPEFSQAYNALGYSLADRNIRLEEAKTLIEKAHELSPDDHYIIDSLGWVHYRLGNLDKAVDFLRQAYSQQPDPEIAAHLGEVLWQQGKHDEAVKTWDSALTAFPENEVLLSTSKKFKR
ncbi:Lipopolysaccharide biosynthesis regulator YciM, contains six TPR domains and a predicted metal-binding C-terminal domain [Methylobacillus rhizosphaerae]|uniref:Lipopolysaccharide biosynthesis regulator YciM, contains six TPR domains and a predicted metal-binding C-terminal domain n=1 Tax=Methylobacillus rhizosphaerae TaxID=551994 RepID=A0A239ACK0_9PROT|nr:tetratricopeptide repeat protein [Methylobacillus rhizosphaerae]SNR93367.1 Lipopolysaccharide biosynthesis regulator YciM, contains six TPR domains and a predicted metal-binding C-terminal domain [Methylobacillus rhizosphaerae]